MSTAAAGPAPEHADRLMTVDALRGIAVLGILLMNITGFAFHPAAYMDPTVQGGATGVNLWVYIANLFLVDGKMRGIFTLLFGASMLLFLTRAEARCGGSAADIYYRRTLWLLLFGIAHAFLLWYGDVLYPYALMGLILYPFRRMSNRGLLILSGVLLVLLTGADTAMYFKMRSDFNLAAQAKQAEKAGRKPTEEQSAAAKSVTEMLKQRKPDAAQLKKTSDALTGGFLSSVKKRAEFVSYWHNQPLYTPGNWDLLIMMLLGMVFLRTGVLTLERSTSFYGWMAGTGYAIGLPLHAVMAWVMIRNGFNLLDQQMEWAVYDPARIAICLAHVAMFLLLIRSGTFGALFRVLAATGRMAFTNYLMQSIFCTLFFNVLGMHGRLQRWQCYVVVACIWTLELVWSPLWLARFYYGPFEWAWRSLAWWRRQRFRIPRLAPLAPTAPDAQPA